MDDKKVTESIDELARRSMNCSSGSRMAPPPTPIASVSDAFK